MSIVNRIETSELDVKDLFTGITANKGDILVNDGTSNIALGVGINGYILTANSLTPTGIEWANSGSIISSSVINISPFRYTTNSVSPEVIPNLSYTNLSGTVYFVGNINVIQNQAHNYFFIGLYLNNVLIANTQKKFGGINDTTFSIPVFYSIALIASDIFSIKINTGDSANSLYIDGIVPYTNCGYQFNTQVFTLNSINPIQIPNSLLCGFAGQTLFIASFECNTNQAYSYFTIGVYKNNSLFKSFQYKTIDSAIFSYTLPFILDMTTTDEIDFKANVSSALTSLTFNTYSVVRYKITSSTLVPQIYNDTLFTSNAQTPQLIPSMTFTGLSGEYFIFFQANIIISNNLSNFDVGIYLNGVLQNVKKMGNLNSVVLYVPFFSIITLTASDTIDFRINTSTTNAYVSIYERSIIYQEII